MKILLLLIAINVAYGADIVNKTTGQYLHAVDPNRYAAGEWWINPDLNTVEGIHYKYWDVSKLPIVFKKQSDIDKIDADATAKVDSITAYMDSLGVAKISAQDKLKANAFWTDFEIKAIQILGL